MQRSMIFVQAPGAWRVDAAITERVVWQARVEPAVAASAAPFR